MGSRRVWFSYVVEGIETTLFSSSVNPRHRPIRSITRMDEGGGLDRFVRLKADPSESEAGLVLLQKPDCESGQGALTGTSTRCLRSPRMNPNSNVNKTLSRRPSLRVEIPGRHRGSVLANRLTDQGEVTRDFRSNARHRGIGSDEPDGGCTDVGQGCERSKGMPGTYLPPGRLGLRVLRLSSLELLSTFTSTAVRVSGVPPIY